MSLSRIESRLPQSLPKPSRCADSAIPIIRRNHQVVNQGSVLGSTLPLFGIYKKSGRNLMGLSGGTQSNGKLRWRWAGNVKIELHDRLCVLVYGDWHRLMPMRTLILTVLNVRVPLQEV
jgi:hypothetical protein